MKTSKNKLNNEVLVKLKPTLESLKSLEQQLKLSDPYQTYRELQDRTIDFRNFLEVIINDEP